MQTDLFDHAPASTLPAGFAYRPELITPAAEQALAAAIAQLPLQPFDFHGYLGKRRVISFGLRYDDAARGVRAAAPIPDFLLDLRRKAADFAGVDAAGLEHVLINEYAAGAGIGWHRDKPQFEDVIAVSLLAPGRLRLRRRAGTSWERRSLTVAPRSAYLLRGEARSVWEHSLPPLEALRYSVTFRNLR